MCYFRNKKNPPFSADFGTIFGHVSPINATYQDFLLEKKGAFLEGIFVIGNRQFFFTLIMPICQ